MGLARKKWYKKSSKLEPNRKWLEKKKYIILLHTNIVRETIRIFLMERGGVAEKVFP